MSLSVLVPEGTGEVPSAGELTADAKVPDAANGTTTLSSLHGVGAYIDSIMP